MQVVPNTPYRDYQSSISPKGQITLPQDTRKKLGLNPKDVVTIRVFDDGNVAVIPKKASFLESYRTIPALNPLRTWEEVREIAREEHIEEATHSSS
jgi:AbrB family looped-hinge helix DNA binding protein